MPCPNMSMSQPASGMVTEQKPCPHHSSRADAACGERPGGLVLEHLTTRASFPRYLIVKRSPSWRPASPDGRPPWTAGAGRDGPPDMLPASSVVSVPPASAGPADRRAGVLPAPPPPGAIGTRSSSPRPPPLTVSAATVTAWALKAMPESDGPPDFAPPHRPRCYGRGSPSAGRPAQPRRSVVQTPSAAASPSGSKSLR